MSAHHPAHPHHEAETLDVDQLAVDVANHLCAQPRAQRTTAAGGGTATYDLPDADTVAAQLRPHLTPEFVALVNDGPGAAPGGVKKPFNLAKFLENLNKILAVAGPIIGIITGVPIPPITIPTGGAAPE